MVFWSIGLGVSLPPSSGRFLRELTNRSKQEGRSGGPQVATPSVKRGAPGWPVSTCPALGQMLLVALLQDLSALLSEYSDDKIHYWKAKYFLGHLEYVILWQNVGSNSKRWRVTLSLWMRVGTVSPGPFFSILASEDGFKVPGA